MACYHPLAGVIQKIHKNGRKDVLVIKTKDIAHWQTKCAIIPLPCRNCLGCKIEKSKEWAIRCVHESQLYENNCFITLTFRPACPLLKIKNKRWVHDPTISLYKRHFQLFMKRLRREMALGVLSKRRKNGKYIPKYETPNIRYLHCGEYGENLGRPHHHAILFNVGFFDKKRWYPSFKAGRDPSIRYYKSAQLNSLWQYGECIIGDVTLDSAAYVARYTQKKVLGENAEHYYDGRLPEYATMSRRPGLGKGWMEKYTNDLFPKDYVVIGGKRGKIPKYYYRNYELTNPEEYGQLKEARSKLINPDNNTARWNAAEKIKKAQLAFVPRNSI